MARHLVARAPFDAPGRPSARRRRRLGRGRGRAAGAGRARGRGRPRVRHGVVRRVGPAVTADVTALPFRDRRVRRRRGGVRGQPPARPGGRADRAAPGDPARRRGARLDVLRRRARRPRARWTRSRRRTASSPPTWYADLQECAHAVGDPASVERALAAAGFARWTVTEEPVDVGLTEPADVVRYRLAVPHLHRFVAPADRRRPRRVRGRRGRGGAPDRRAVRAGRRRSRRRRPSPAAPRRPSGTPGPARPPRGPRARPAARPWPARAPIRSRRPRRRPATSPRARPPRPGRRGPRRGAGSSTGSPEPRLRGRADQPGQHGVAGVTALLGGGGHRLRRVERGRGVLLGEREPGQEQPPALVEPPLVVEPPGARLGLRDREPVGGPREVTGAEQAVRDVEVALGEDLLRPGQPEAGQRELLGGRVAEVAQDPAPVGVLDAGVPHAGAAPLDLALEPDQHRSASALRPSSP